MTGRSRSGPEVSLGARALERDEDLSEGGLSASIERDGQSRVARVRNEDGALLVTLCRYPAAGEPDPSFPDWLPFLPGVGCVVTDLPLERLVVYHVFARPADWMRRMAARFMELIKELDLPDPSAFERPDGTVDQDAMVAYMRENRTELPPEVLEEVTKFWNESGADPGALDRAWDQLRAWHAGHGWTVEDQEPRGPVVATCGFARGAERRLATAMSMAGMQQIMVFFRSQADAGGA